MMRLAVLINSMKLQSGEKKKSNQKKDQIELEKSYEIRHFKLISRNCTQDKRKFNSEND